MPVATTDVCENVSGFVFPLETDEEFFDVHCNEMIQTTSCPEVSFMN